MGRVSVPDLGSVRPHALGSCVRGCASGPECSSMSPWICVCPVCRSVGEGMAVGQDTSVCAAVSVCVCVCVSAIAVCPCAHRPCPLCVFAVCPYVCVSAPQTVCVSAASESSSACPAGVLATVVATSISRPSVCPPVLLGRGGAGSGGKRRGEGVSTSPPTPAPSPHSLGPGIEPYLESRFDICFQI